MPQIVLDGLCTVHISDEYPHLMCLSTQSSYKTVSLVSKLEEEEEEEEEEGGEEEEEEKEEEEEEDK